MGAESVEDGAHHQDGEDFILVGAGVFLEDDSFEVIQDFIHIPSHPKSLDTRSVEGGVAVGRVFAGLNQEIDETFRLLRSFFDGL